MKPFDYPNTLDEKVKFLAWEVTKKNEVLTSSQTSLSKVDYALEKVNHSLDTSIKR